MKMKKMMALVLSAALALTTFCVPLMADEAEASDVVEVTDDTMAGEDDLNGIVTYDVRLASAAVCTETKPAEPKLTVTYISGSSGIFVTKEVDPSNYEVTFSNNNVPGMATAHIQGKNGYSDLNRDFFFKVRGFYSVYGNDRYETAVRLAKDSHDGLAVKKMIIADGKKFPDALAASVLVDEETVMVMSSTKSLNRFVKEAIQNVWTLDKIIVVGGAFEAQFFSDLNALGYAKDGGKLLQLAGNDRYETALKVAAYAHESKNYNYDICAVATGKAPYDAMSFSTSAAYGGIPIYLVGGSGTANAATQAAINQYKYVVILGGDAVVKDSVVSGRLKRSAEEVLTETGPENSYCRIGGNDRYQTSQLLLEALEDSSWTSDGAIMAHGGQSHWPDALVAGNYGFGNLAPVLLVNSGNTGATTYLANKLSGTLSVNPNPYTNFLLPGFAGIGTEAKVIKDQITIQDMN
ncbi:MAG: cell wall-binding repeat-containing protein [Lachnospiraceae bacterium]|nr:cell wall-binding repeat-containing protein [Lachnospiraceae bacterium]